MKVNRLVQNLIVILIIGFFMVFFKSILIPLAFGILFAILLAPVSEGFEKTIPRIPAILLTITLLLLVLVGIGTFFLTQFYNQMGEGMNAGGHLQDTLNGIIDSIRNFARKNGLTFIENQLKPGEDTGNLINIKALAAQVVSKSTNFLVSFVLVIMYTFLFLLYRDSFYKFISLLFKQEQQSQIQPVVSRIKDILQNYFSGLAIVIFIQGVLYAVGYWILGLDYPVLFGLFAAMLTIIPYIGTTFGGAVPAVFALVVQGNVTLAILVVVWNIIVQMIEGNIVTPNIVGNKVSINPLFAILSIFIGGAIWGIPGMALFFPIMAIAKVVLEHIPSMEHYALLLSSDFGSSKTSKFMKFSLRRKRKEISRKPVETPQIFRDRTDLDESTEETKY